ncbi:MAG: hypothetical protein QXT13_06950 [Pyrobaculum sp.]
MPLLVMIDISEAPPPSHYLVGAEGDEIDRRISALGKLVWRPYNESGVSVTPRDFSVGISPGRGVAMILIAPPNETEFLKRLTETSIKELGTCLNGSIIDFVKSGPLELIDYRIAWDFVTLEIAAIAVPAVYIIRRTSPDSFGGTLATNEKDFLHIITIGLTQLISLAFDPRWGPFTAPICLAAGLNYKPPPPCPAGEASNASGYVYGPCQYDGSFEYSKPTCRTGEVIRIEPLSCVASDGRYAASLARVEKSACPAHTPPCEPVVCPAVLIPPHYYLLVVDLNTG